MWKTKKGEGGVLFCVVINIISSAVESSLSAAPLALGKTIFIQQIGDNKSRAVSLTTELA